YYACNEKFIYDIAIAINDWCITKDGKINNLMSIEFLNGYESIRKLLNIEYDYLNIALRMAALRFWLSRLEDFHNIKEGEITSIKDPSHFKNILLDRQTMKNYAN
ncbi:homoserine kinase, partial [Nitrosomonadales bacterium]|nr:homoserine kinase [Nitrosomonadales bacterium]